MELSHRFTVPVGVEETWAHFNDIASVAECFPGAQVTEADEESFAAPAPIPAPGWSWSPSPCRGRT